MVARSSILFGNLFGSATVIPAFATVKPHEKKLGIPERDGKFQGALLNSSTHSQSKGASRKCAIEREDSAIHITNQLALGFQAGLKKPRTCS
jgi:hypothetical protein